ncbi:hypothetical protein GCM10022239_03120 [Leifsonia bigeumensis]|uniref:PH domain-containing protein n=1 Tax=Leifsonella bigeumensis TaxID=433643 RepID=A0ABP7F2H0_9MICO
MQRLKGSGTLARWLATAAFVIVTVSFLAFLSDGGGQGLLAACIFQFVATVTMLRSMYIGVYVGSDRVRFVSWMRRFTLEWSGIRRSDAIPYSGFLSKSSDTNFASMIRVTLADGRMIELQSTVGGPRAVRRQAASLNRLIQVRSCSHGA